MSDANVLATSDTRAVVEAFCAARAANDRAVIASLLDADVEWHAPYSVRNRALRSRDLVAKALTGGTTGRVLDVDSIQREVTQMVVEGDVAVVRQLMTARLLSGGDYRNDYCWIYQVRNGLISRIDEYGDTLVIARAGFIPLRSSDDSLRDAKEDR